MSMSLDVNGPRCSDKRVLWLMSYRHHETAYLSTKKDASLSLRIGRCRLSQGS